jgi:signal transduction histidine kinase
LGIILGLSLCVWLAVALLSLGYAKSLERQTERQFRQMSESKKDLEMLSARLVEVQESERKSLARELHDEVGQTLTALRIDISHAQSLYRSGSSGVEDRLDRAHALAERSVQSIRDISIVLRPSVLDDLGLGPALQWQVKDFGKRTGASASFAEEGLHDDLPDEVKTCVYRVVQEALHNCEKHAGATRVKVLVRQAPELLAVEIIDNGSGFERDSSGLPIRSAGLGILGMRERAFSLGGTLAIETARGRGTRVVLSLPLAAEDEEEPEVPPLSRKRAEA